MGIGNDAPQFIQGVVQVVHPSSFPGINVQSDGFALTSLLLSNSSLTGTRGTGPGRIEFSQCTFVVSENVAFNSPAGTFRVILIAGRWEVTRGAWLGEEAADSDGAQRGPPPGHAL